MRYVLVEDPLLHSGLPAVDPSLQEGELPQVSPSFLNDVGDDLMSLASKVMKLEEFENLQN
jgi:hypothetical protein